VSSLATPEQLGQFLGIPLAVGEQTERVQMLLDGATGLVRGFTGQYLSAVANEDIALPPSRTRRLFLPERPVTALGPVTIDAEVVSVTAYEWTRYGVLRRTDGEIWRVATTGQIAVRYSHGFAQDSEEMADAVAVVLGVAARAWTAGPDDIESFTPADTAGFTTALFLTAAERQQLSRFRMPVYA